MLQIKTRCGITSADNYRTYEQPPPLIVMFEVGLDLRFTDLPIICERRELWVGWKRSQIWYAKVSLGMKVLTDKCNTSLITRCDIFDWGLDQSSIWHLKSFSIGDFFHFQHSSHFFYPFGLQNRLVDFFCTSNLKSFTNYQLRLPIEKNWKFWRRMHLLWLQLADKSW